MPWDTENENSWNNIHDVMMMLGDGGSIYTLGPHGNVPYPKRPEQKSLPGGAATPSQGVSPSTFACTYTNLIAPPIQLYLPMEPLKQ
jgi:hypothetical protein